jgi:hypothetical protein
LPPLCPVFGLEPPIDPWLVLELRPVSIVELDVVCMEPPMLPELDDVLELVDGDGLDWCGVGAGVGAGVGGGDGGELWVAPAPPMDEC